MGTYKTMLTDWDYREVQSFDNLEQIWDSIKGIDPGELIVQYQDQLQTQLDLPMNILLPKESEFFKHHYRGNWHNQGVMVRELDVIRKHEGW